MKKGILFITLLALVAISLVLLINASVKAHAWYTMLPMILLPAATWIYLKVDFKKDDKNLFKDGDRR